MGGLKQGTVNTRTKIPSSFNQAATLCGWGERGRLLGGLGGRGVGCRCDDTTEAVDVAQWLMRRNLKSEDPWVRSPGGVGREVIFLSLRVNSRADLTPLRVYGAHPNLYAHV